MRFPWSRYHGSVHGGEDRDVETIRIILARTAWPGTCQVMTPESADSGFTRMLVPTDFSSGSEQAWAVARQLAARLGAEIVLLHVLVEAPLFPEGLFMEHARDVFDAAQRWAENMLGEWTAGAAAAGLEVRWVVCPRRSCRRPRGSEPTSSCWARTDEVGSTVRCWVVSPTA
jgi:universal stress protein family protein